jgi:hypothetical protein
MDNTDIRTHLIRHDERLRNIYSSLARIEKHLEKLNGKVDRHDTEIAKVQVYGAIALIAFPVVFNLVMRYLP